MLEAVVWGVVAVTSLWVLVDARAIGVQKGQVPGFTDMGPVGWFLACVLFWIVGFPMYIARRNAYLLANGKDSRGAFPAIFGALVVASVVLSLVVTIAAEPNDSAPALEAQVLHSIRQSWAETPTLQGAKIDVVSFRLTHKAGKHYEGKLEVMLDGQMEVFFVDVMHDDETYMWQIR